MSLSADADFSATGKAKGIISIADKLSIVCGDASIIMEKDGKITIKDKDITIEGSGKISAKADSDITMKGSKIHQN